MQLNREEYRKHFQGEKQEKALERAWKNRDFEIELYWKRATYFWTFLVATFAGYFVVISRPEVHEAFPQAELVVTCLGIIFSLAWYLVNRGSKKWQENWEKHIDMLEEEVTGNIYKIVLDKTSYSVSGINLKVSLFVMVIWFLLSVNFYYKSFDFGGEWNTLDLRTLIVSTTTLVFIIALLFERRKSNKSLLKNDNGIPKISFSLREFEYTNRPMPSTEEEIKQE